MCAWRAPTQVRSKTCAVTATFCTPGAQPCGATDASPSSGSHHGAIQVRTAHCAGAPSERRHSYLNIYIYIYKRGKTFRVEV